MVNLFSVYELNTWSQDINTDFIFKNCLFGSVKLTKNADLDKFKYSSYGIGFVLLPNNTTRRNIIIFGANFWSILTIIEKIS